MPPPSKTKQSTLKQQNNLVQLYQRNKQKILTAHTVLHIFTQQQILSVFSLLRILQITTWVCEYNREQEYQTCQILSLEETKHFC